MKKLIALLIVTSVVGCMICGCSSQKESKSKTNEESKEASETENIDENNDTVYNRYIYSNSYSGDISIEAAPSNLSQEFSTMTITPKMLRGNHDIIDDDGYDSYDKSMVDYNIDNYFEQAELVNIEEFLGFNDNSFNNMCPLPVQINVEPHALGIVNNENYCTINYYGTYDDVLSTDNKYLITVRAFYTIENNKITFKYLSDYSITDDNVINYQLSGTERTYDLSITYNTITCGYGSNSVKLYTKYGNSFERILMNEEWNDKSDKFDNIIALSINYKDENTQNVSITVDEGGENPVYYSGIARISEDGVLSLKYTDNNGDEHTYHALLIDNGQQGFVVIYNGNCCEFNAKTEASIENSVNIKGYVTFNVLPEDEEKLSVLTPDSIETLNSAKDSFMDDLTKELSANGIDVIIDEETGAIVIDAAVLFDNNEFELDGEGMNYLDAMESAFLTVLSDEKYDGLFSSILIQGHTDSHGSYDHNKELSLNRAESVRDYLVSGLDESNAAAIFKNLLQTEGCASDYIIYNEDGSENREASRRVVFMFYVDLDYINN